MSSAFESSRQDGRSCAQVVMDYVCDGEPGRVYTYAELAKVLGEGSARVWDRVAVRGAVRAAYARMLKELQRTLHNVRGRGYRLAPAGEHNRLALERKRRADLQMKRGLQMLQHVRWEEMGANERAAHQGTLIVLGTFYENMKALDRRLQRVEDVIESATGLKLAGKD